VDFCYIYIDFVCLFPYNQFLFWAKFRTVAKSENNLWQAQMVFFMFFKSFTKKEEKKALFATFKTVDKK
jgi:hypothetical protein